MVSKPVSGRCDKLTLLGALCPVQIGYDMASREKGWQVIEAEGSTCPVFMLDCDGNRHAELDINSYLWIASFRVALDTGNIDESPPIGCNGVSFT